MPSSTHEALIELFRRRPELAAELLAGPLGVTLPSYQEARVESGELTDLVPTEYRADAVVVLTAAGTPSLAVVVEAQLGRDPAKRWSWPVYLATLRARLRCPTTLLVLCPDAAVATWCAAPIDLGHPGWTLRPLVAGPDRIPVVADPDEAYRSPELAVLSAIAHGANPRRTAVLNAMLSGLKAVDDEHANLYADLVLAALPAAARHLLEELMATGTYEYQSDFARRYYHQGQAEGKAEGQAEGRAEGQAEGRAEGEAKALLAVLAARDIPIPEDARDRITGCTDLDQLDTWIRRAVTIESIDDLFT